MTAMGEEHRWEHLVRSTLSTLAQVLDVRCPYTGQHSRRAAHYAFILAEELRVPTREKSQLQIGALLHDLGVIGIDDAVLHKLGPLTAYEFEIMKTHTVIGAKILEQTPHLAYAIPIVRSHHERWAGDGYPDRLSGDEIPYLARITAVADAFDAMTSDHPYRHGMTVEAAFAQLAEQSGKQFDPDIARAFIGIRQRVRTIHDSVTQTCP